MASIQAAVNGSINYRMDEEIDHLMVFEALAREVRSHSYEFIDLRDYWNAKRLDPDAIPCWRSPGDRRKAKRAFTPEQIADMTFSTDSTRVVAARNGVSQQTVANFRLKSK